MASRSRPHPKKGKRAQLPDMGLFDLPDLDAIDNVSDDSDCDEGTLESELAALMSGKEPPKRQKMKPKANQIVDIEKLAAECLTDPVDEDDDEDENLSDDEDMLKELHHLTANESTSEEVSIDPKENESCISSTDANEIISLLKERFAMYNEALEVAKENKDSSKIRRYNRAIQTLNSQMKLSKSGEKITEEDIPPPVKIAPAKPMPASAENLPVSSVVQSHSSAIDSKEKTDVSPATLELISRREQYKKAALQAKKDGDKETALTYMRTVKTFNAVIEALENGQPVDLSNMPPPLTQTGFSGITTVSKIEPNKKMQENIQTSSDFEKAALAAANDSEPSDIFTAPSPPATILEALEQRFDKYTKTKQAAEAEGNSGKVRRLQRIVKQYEVAIKDHKAGKNVDYEDLPTPPGYAPIPVCAKESLPLPIKPTSTEHQQGQTVHEKKPSQPIPTTAAGKGAKPKLQRSSTLSEKTLEFLLERQKLFRQAALTAKQNGDIQQAKEYLRMSKGFDSMIEATKCGLPIDTSTIPTPPQLDSDFIIVDQSDCNPNENITGDETLENLEQDLRRQIEVCTQNKEHFLRLGDVQSASKFEKLSLETKKDLSVIQHLQKLGDEKQEIPKFHYETRLFSIVQCNTHLSDDDLEVTVVRGISLPGKPNELDSYVKLEFPLPANTLQFGKTHTIRDTQDPEYKTVIKFILNRQSRNTLRAFKRQALKLEVWSKGGFLRSDSLLGTVNVKLADLESKCTVHDSYNLMTGRKAVGGKLEVKLCIREPLLVKQVEQVKEKWLVIGS